MKLKNDKFFKNFNNNYLLFINNFYQDNPITHIKNEIKKQIKQLQIRNNVKQIKERNINYWLIRGWSYEDGIKINGKNHRKDICCKKWRIWYSSNLG